MPKKYIHIIVFMLIAAFCSTAAGQIQVSAQIDESKTIYVGERFVFYVVIDGLSKAADVDLTPLSEFDPQSAGNEEISKILTGEINGKTTQTSSFSANLN